MFQNLSDKLHDALRHLRGQAILTEANITESMEEIRTALLEADVNLDIAEDFVKTVRAECLGGKVIKSVTPGQMAVKIVYDRLTALMGEAAVPLVSGKSPAVILMCGLHGSGKTTTSAKLALSLKNQGRKILLAALDVYRPAAIDQLEILGREIGVPVHSERNVPDVTAIALRALERARSEGADYLIMDTAGRLQIDEPMVQELVRVKDVTRPDEILLVADAALGQQAVSVAKHFHDALGLTGIVLTKLDGDARGGAALSIRSVTGCPVKFAGTGEKLEDLDVFHPDRMASRILGMGDVVSLVERAAEKFDQEEAAKLEEKFKKNSFDFDDFLSQLRQMSRLGGVESILKFLPGGDKLADMPEFDSKKFRSMEAIICSMTKKERANAELIDMSRKRRIARGSGRPQEEVSQLIRQFLMMKKMMKNTGLLNRIVGSSPRSGGAGLGAMFSPGMSGGFGGMGGMGRGGFMARGSNYTPPKKKRKK
ncbi:MAG: signal recognition particle protein [Lentisphaeria bacterium]|nr:signal recognition particle protein [Lentisphaeria bacterium]